MGTFSSVLPGLSARMFRLPSEDVTPAVLAATAMFGVREAVVGGLTYAVGDDLSPDRQRLLLRLNAACDAVDALAVLAVAARHRRYRPALVILPIAAASVVTHLQAARKIGSVA